MHPLASRPSPRVLLLSGPPGLGKTTLTHVLAGHCGYAVMEVNASDDRTETELIERVRGVVEHREGVWGSGAERPGNRKGVKGRDRPRCLVIDEIDGVLGGAGEGGGGGAGGGGAIAALVRLATAEGGGKGGGGEEAIDADGEKADDADDDDEGGEREGGATSTPAQEKLRGRSKKGKTHLPPLRRPIICICNDPYIPALRPLRAIAAHHHVAAPTKPALLARLRYIAKREGVDVDDAALSSIIDLTQGDVRSSLNSLQWIAEGGGRGGWRGGGGAAEARDMGGGRGDGVRARERMTVERLREVGVGVKDFTKGRFDLLDLILSSSRRPPPTRRITADHPSDADDSTASILSACTSADDGQRVVQALHANYLGLGMADPTLAGMVGLAHAFSRADEWAGGGGGGDEEGGGGGGGGSLPVLAVTIHREAVRCIRRLPRTLPDESWKLQGEAMRRVQLLRDWQTTADLVLPSSPLSPTVLAVEVLSSLLHILCPALRPVAFNLLAPHERRAVERLIGVMADVGVNFEPVAGGGAVMGGRWGGGAEAGGGAGGQGVEYVMVPRVDGLVEYEWTEEVVAWMRREERWGDKGKGKWGKDKGKGGGKATTAGGPVEGAPVKADVIPGKVRQMLWKEVEHERIRRQERRRQEGGSGGEEGGGGLVAAVVAAEKGVGEEKAGWRVARAKEEARKAEAKRKAQDREEGKEEADAATAPSPERAKRRTTFLSEHSARLRKKAEEGGKAAQGKGGKEGGPAEGAGGGSVFHYVHKEGFTQAVRRRVTMAHFL